MAAAPDLGYVVAPLGLSCALAVWFCLSLPLTLGDCYLLSTASLRGPSQPLHYWNAKVGSQETPGVTGKFGLGVQNEAGQRLIEFCQENTLVIANTLFQQHKRRLHTWTSPDGQHQNQIDYIFVAKDEEALYSQQKQNEELTVAQIMNSLLPNSDLKK